VRKIVLACNLIPEAFLKAEIISTYHKHPQKHQKKMKIVCDQGCDSILAEVPGVDLQYWTGAELARADDLWTVVKNWEKVFHLLFADATHERKTGHFYRSSLSAANPVPAPRLSST